MAGNPNAALLIINQQTYWPTEGTEPADVSKDWKPRQRPPSAWFDWFFRATYKDIEALALFMQEYGMTRGFGPGLFEFPGTTGAEIGFVGTNNLPVGYMAAGVERQLHIADRVVQPTGEDTLVKVVWSSPNTLASKDARLTVGYRETGAGDSRDGALTEITQVVGDSTTEMGQNETWFTISGLTQGKALDLFVIVEAAHETHTLTEPVYIHQVFIDPEAAS